MLRQITNLKRRVGTLAALVIAAAVPLGAQGQTGQIVGTVTNADDQQPVGQAQISIQGTSIGVLGATNGSFTLPGVPVGGHIVLVQRLGFQAFTQTNVNVTAGATTTLNIALRPTVLSLQGIVATGLVDPVEGVRSPITVGRVDRETMPVPVAGSAVGNLQGRVAGVFMVRRDGTPGQDVEMRLRSQTSIDRTAQPLIVVDGVILGAGTTNLESLDIVSIEVVKGASAASLYGSRAAAGVIQITTNRGQGLQMGQTQFVARSEFGFTSSIKAPRHPTHHHYLVDDEENPTTYVDVNGNPVSRANRVAPPELTAFIDNPYFVPLYDNVSSGAVFNPAGFQTHNFTISQNAADTNFSVNLSRYYENGPLENNDGFVRNSFRMNLDHRFLNTMSLGVSAFHSRDALDETQGLNFNNLYTLPPEIDLTVRDENGEYVRIPDPAFEIVNPLWTLANRESQRNRVRTLGSANLRWEPLSWLAFMGNASYDRQDSKTRRWIPKGVPEDFDDDQAIGSLSYINSLSDAWNSELQVQLRRDFGPLNVSTMLRGLLERDRSESVSASGENFLVAGVPSLDAVADQDQSSASSESEIRALGYLWSADLSYADKYIASGLLRRDGSSLFGPDDRWHNYYRAAFKWRMGEEPWFNVPHVGEFSLSYARGTAGGRPEFSDQYEVWSVGSSGISKGSLGNRNLRPEHTLEQEVSVEAILFDRLSVDFAHAWQRTSDQLFNEVLPSFTGYANQWTNGGVVYGQTTELTLEAQMITTSRFLWQSMIVADHSWGKIEEWPFACTAPSNTLRCANTPTNSMFGVFEVTDLSELDTPRYYVGANVTDCHQGCAIAEAGRLDEFVLDDGGLVVWVGKDANGNPNHYLDGPGADGVLGTTDDLWGTSTVVDGRSYFWGIPFIMADGAGVNIRSQIGTTEHVGVGFINNFGFGALSLHVQLQGAIGGDVGNDRDSGMITSQRAPIQEQGGKPEQLKKPLAYYTVLWNSGANSKFFWEPGSFLKLRTLSATYRFTQAQLAQIGLGRIGVTAAQLGLIGRDIFTITSYSGWDPERGLRPNGTPPNDAANTYPPTRAYTVEVQLTF